MNPRIKFKVIERLYQDDKTSADIYTQKTQIDIDKKKYNYGLKIIESLSSRNKGKIMDLGCGAGYFLKQANLIFSYLGRIQLNLKIFMP